MGKKNHPSTHPNSNWLHHELCPRPDQAGMFSFPLHGLAHVPSQAKLREELRPERRLLHCPAWCPPLPILSPLCPTQQHSSVCPSCCPLHFASKPCGHWHSCCRFPAKEGEEVCDQQKPWKDGHPLLWIAKRCASWKPRAKFWVMSKDSAFLLTFLNSQHCHNSLANFRRNLFKMWE